MHERLREQAVVVVASNSVSYFILCTYIHRIYIQQLWDEIITEVPFTFPFTSCEMLTGIPGKVGSINAGLVPLNHFQQRLEISLADAI